MADNLRKEGAGLLNGIEVIAVDCNRPGNVGQPLTPGVDLLPGGFAIAAAAYEQRRRAQRRGAIGRIVVIMLGGVKIGAQEGKKQRY